MYVLSTLDSLLLTDYYSLNICQTKIINVEIYI